MIDPERENDERAVHISSSGRVELLKADIEALSSWVKGEPLEEWIPWTPPLFDLHDLAAENMESPKPSRHADDYTGHLDREGRELFKGDTVEHAVHGYRGQILHDEDGYYVEWDCPANVELYRTLDHSWHWVRVDGQAK